jgi:hypothetical protein
MKSQSRWRRNCWLTALAISTAAVAAIEWRMLQRTQPTPVAQEPPASPPVVEPQPTTSIPKKPSATQPERLKIRPREVVTVERLTIVPKEYRPAIANAMEYLSIFGASFRLRPSETMEPKETPKLPAIRGIERPRGGMETLPANRKKG